MRPLAVALVAIPLAACLLGPNYHRPSVEMPGAYPYAPAEARDTVNTTWWVQFQDPVLDGLITEALARNLSVQIAAANVEQAAAVLTQARAPLYPQVNAGASGTRERGSEAGAGPIPPSVPNPQTSYQVLAGASWEIDLWGRLRRLTESAQADLLATDQARRGVILSLVATVATGYLQLRGLDEQLAMAERTQAAYAESLRVMELKFKYGRVSQMNVEQARARYESPASQIPRIRREIAILENGLSVLLGRSPGAIPRGKSIFEITLPPVPAGVPSELLERRPDLLQAEQQLISPGQRDHVAGRPGRRRPRRRGRGRGERRQDGAVRQPRRDLQARRDLGDHDLVPAGDLAS